MKSAPYLKIADSIRNDIVKKGLAPHARLPSESELVERYGVARATVRRALARLQEERLVYSRVGSGSFVSEARVRQDLDQLFSFTEFMVYRGLKPGARVLNAEVRRLSDADPAAAEHLKLKRGARVIFLRRLRLGNGEPLVIANTWMPEKRLRGFLECDLERRSVYEIMEAMGQKPADAVQTMEAVTLDGEEADLLAVPRRSAAMLIRRVGYAHGLPVEYAEDYYRGDRTTFRVRLGVLEQRLTEKSDGVLL